MKHDMITLTGLVATEPKHLTTDEGLPITSFRLASGQGWYDREAKNWVDKGTNWYTVSSFRRLALGSAASLTKGDRVIVTGRLRFREWSNSSKEGTSVEIDADAIGHDLNWGTAKYTRTMGGSGAETGSADPPAEPAVDPAAGMGFFAGVEPPVLGVSGESPLDGGESALVSSAPAGEGDSSKPF